MKLVVIIIVICLKLQVSLASSEGALGIVGQRANDAIFQRDFNYKEFKITIKDKTFIGIEIWVSQPQGVMQSSFGHAAVRFIDNDEEIQNDLIVSFESMSPANSNESSVVSNLLTRKNVIIPRITSFIEYVNDHIINQGRLIRRFIIPSNKEIIDHILIAVENIIRAPDLIEGYNFFFNNCSDAILKVLQDAGYPVSNYGINTPSGLFATLFNSKLLPYPEITSIAGIHLIEGRVLKLLRQINNLRLARVKNPRQNLSDILEPVVELEIKKAINKMSDSDVIKLYRLWHPGLGTKPAALIDRYQIISVVNSDNYPTYSDLIGYSEVPDLLYRFCSLEKKCLNEKIIASQNFFERKLLNNHKFFLKANFNELDPTYNDLQRESVKY
jgi:hypothetical protein